MQEERIRILPPFQLLRFYQFKNYKRVKGHPEFCLHNEYDKGESKREEELSEDKYN